MLHDREKVIKELEERIKVAEECMGNPMFTPDAIRTIVALLKEQEERINKMLHQPRTAICCYRCKWNSGTQDKPYCQKYSMARLPEWFCADGERRTDDA